jgi:hypothetical protein
MFEPRKFTGQGDVQWLCDRLDAIEAYLATLDQPVQPAKGDEGVSLCSDCPPAGYEDCTRCEMCPRNPTPAIQITEPQSKSLHDALIASFDDFTPPAKCDAPATEADAQELLVPRDVAESWRARAENLAEERANVLDDIAMMMSKHVKNWPEPKRVKTAIALIDKTLTFALRRPLRVVEDREVPGISIGTQYANGPTIAKHYRKMGIGLHWIGEGK